MSDKIELLEKNVSHLSNELKEIKELIGAGFVKVVNNFDSIKEEIDLLHSKVDSLNKKVDLLEGNTKDGLEDVGLKLENLSDEISKISKVTGYDEVYDNMKVIK